MQRLSKGNQKTTPFYYYVGRYEKVNGINKRVFEIETDANEKPVVRFCNFSTYGGNEYENNGVVVVDDTANVVCWFDPAITAGGAIQLCDSGVDSDLFEILGTPENIEMRNQELTFKVRRFKGGA